MIRRDAAIKLVVAGEMNGWDALLLVVAPPPALANIGQRKTTYRPEVREDARRLHAGGLSMPEVARRLGVPYATAKSWIWPASEAEKQRRTERQRRARQRRQQMAA